MPQQAVPVTSARSGKGGRVSVDGSTLVGPSQFSATAKGDDQDTTNFESDGYETGLIGIEMAEFSFGGDFNPEEVPFDDPPGIFVRDDLPNVKLIENVSDDIYWNFPYARVLAATMRCTTRGKVEFEAPTCKSNGTFDLPTA